MIQRVRAMSLASRFLVTLAVTAVLPLLLYGWFSLRSMREQIDEQVVRVFLPQLAADHAQQIEAHLQQTVQACAIVREIARRPLQPDRQAQTADAARRRRDSEIRSFQEQIELVPDLLDNFLDLLLLADANGRVVYWQDGQRLDPSSHGRRAALVPANVADADWFVRTQRERGMHFLPWGRSGLMFGGREHRSMDPGSHHIGIAIDVPQDAGPPAVLFALSRWAPVQEVLDRAREVLVDSARLPQARVFLVGRDGVVQAHTDRANYGLLLEPPSLRQQVMQATVASRGSFTDPAGARWRVGYAPCGTGATSAFVIGVAVPESELFAASDKFESVLLIAIIATVLALLGWSLVASRTITAPVQALVAATRRIADGDLSVSVPPRGGPELGELAGAFNQMAGELAIGREKLAAAQRDQAWAEMARQVAHEVKNPLQPMRMAAQLLQRARSEQDPRADMVADRLARTVLEQTDALDRIASDFRAFAGVAPAQRTTVAARDWLQQLQEQLLGLFVGKAVQLAADFEVGDARLALDAKAIGRVFVNLVQNAHEAAPAGVRVRLRARVTDGRVVVAIEDDGPGIPEPVRARLFEPYFTTKTSGTGLGLAICRRLIEAHGGTIKLARSQPGATEFEITLSCTA